MSDTTDQIDVLLRTVCQLSFDRREEFDRMDDVAGDGDFGTTLARGTAALAADPPSGDAAVEQLDEFVVPTIRSA